MLQENKVSEELNDSVLVEKTLTDDGRKKEKHVKEERIGEETHKVIEVFEEIPLSLKLKTKVIEKTKNFNLVYERETITYNSETGEILDVSIEALDLPSLKERTDNKINIANQSNNYQVKSIIKSLEDKVKVNSNGSKKMLDRVLLGVVIAQLAYLVYYFLIK